MSEDSLIHNDRDEHPRQAFDEHHFESLFKDQFILLCAWCQYSFGFDLQQAKEIVHASFIKLWESRSVIDPTRSVHAYLRKIISNESIDLTRQQKVRLKHAPFLPAADNTESEGFSSNNFKQLQLDIDKAISTLPEQMRRIFELSRFRKLTYTQIAERLHVSVKTVETQMSRALVKLRQALAHHLLFLLPALLMPLAF